ALGADARAVRRLIVRRGAAVSVVGIALGTGAGLLLTRLLQSMLNDVKPTDPSVYVANAALCSPCRWRHATSRRAGRDASIRPWCSGPTDTTAFFRFGAARATQHR